MNILINLMQTVSCTVETLELAKGLSENGENVSLILSDHIENKSDWEKSREMFNKIYYVDTHTSKNDLLIKTLKFILIGRKKMKSFFRRDDFDYLINTMGNYWDPLIPSLVKADNIVTYIHDPIPHSGTAKWKQLLRVHRYKQADQIVVHTKSFIPIVKSLYGFPASSIHFVPHSRLSTYKECWVKVEHDSKYNDSTNFVFFGHIQKYKGLHVLSKAYSILLSMGYTVTLTIAGSGDFSEYEDEYSKLENVRIENRRILDEEIGNLFSLPNAVAVLPYLDATQSGVIVTAMEFSVPIIASDTGGLREQLDDGNIGILCKPGDPEDLAKKMAIICENRDEYNHQQKLMEQYISSLDRKVVAKRLINCLDELS